METWVGEDDGEARGFFSGGRSDLSKPAFESLFDGILKLFLGTAAVEEEEEEADEDDEESVFFLALALATGGSSPSSPVERILELKALAVFGRSFLSFFSSFFLSLSDATEDEEDFSGFSDFFSEEEEGGVRSDFSDF